MASPCAYIHNKTNNLKQIIKPSASSSIFKLLEVKLASSSAYAPSNMQRRLWSKRETCLNPTHCTTFVSLNTSILA